MKQKYTIKKFMGDDSHAQKVIEFQNLNEAWEMIQI